MTGQEPTPSSFRTVKHESYASAYMMDEQLAGDRRKLRIDRIQQGIVADEVQKLAPGRCRREAHIHCGPRRFADGRDGWAVVSYALMRLSPFRYG